LGVGAIGGAAVVAAAIAVPQRRRLFVGLVLLGIVPFAALAWTA